MLLVDRYFPHCSSSKVTINETNPKLACQIYVYIYKLID
jgi:hypothetical protein